MERERQEPTFGKADLSEVEIRPRHRHGPRTSANALPSDESRFWLRAIILVVAAVLIAMGLIEWNARRQVAALERALTPTPEQQAKIEAELKQLERQMAAAESVGAAEAARLRQLLWEQSRPAPLRAGQRCIQGRRLERIEGGWRDLPKEPC